MIPSALIDIWLRRFRIWMHRFLRWVSLKTLSIFILMIPIKRRVHIVICNFITIFPAFFITKTWTPFLNINTTVHVDQFLLPFLFRLFIYLNYKYQCTLLHKLVFISFIVLITINLRSRWYVSVTGLSFRNRYLPALLVHHIAVTTVLFLNFHLTNVGHARECLKDP